LQFNRAPRADRHAKIDAPDSSCSSERGRETLPGTLAIALHSERGQQLPWA
jgi:hypothetical protein